MSFRRSYMSVYGPSGPVFLATVDRVRVPHFDDLVCAGIVLKASDSESRCDNEKVAGPLVRHDGEKYLMWYYCQGTTTHKATISLPLGDIALATSPDGLNWTRQEVCASEAQCSLTKCSELKNSFCIPVD
jgi:hypothetical protein